MMSHSLFMAPIAVINLFSDILNLFLFSFAGNTHSQADSRRIIHYLVRNVSYDLGVRKSKADIFISLLVNIL